MLKTNAIDAGKSDKEMSVQINTILFRKPDQEFSSIDEEVVMLNQENGEYYALNTIGSRIWELIYEPISVQNVIDLLLEEFEVEVETCKVETIQLLNELLNRSLIRIV